MALFTLGAGFYYGYESWQLFERGRSVTATVVAYHERVSDEDQQITVAPVVEFLVDGRPYRFASAAYRSRPAYAIGATVDVLYDPISPEQARLNRFGDLWGIPLALTSIGAVLVVIGVGMLRRRSAPAG
jgi:hypothetical protein